jgi:hypothetical protein
MGKGEASGGIGNLDKIKSENEKMKEPAESEPEAAEAEPEEVDEAETSEKETPTEVVDVPFTVSADLPEDSKPVDEQLSLF